MGQMPTGAYIQVVDAAVHLGDPDSNYERTRFLELAVSGGEDSDDPPKFEEVSNLVWNDHKCTPRGDIHELITDA